MQTLIDIPEEDLTRLDELSEDRQVPRDELVRTALSAYLQAQPTKPRHTKEQRKMALDASFGLWAGRNGDGLEYQQRMRDEWPK